MDLDAAWLADPARMWPVTVDPDIQFPSEQDDTFVSTRDYANQNNSSQPDLRVGTYDWGGEVSESFLHFDSAMSQLTDKVITSASLSAYNYWSYSCNPTEVWLHALAQPWAGWSTTAWPGPAFYATALDAQSFANGYSGCGAGPNWATWNIPPEYMNAWAHGESPFYGFTLRASRTDALGWKRFRSSNYGDPSQRPALSVTYTLQPPGLSAVYPLQDAVVDTLTPTIWVRAVDPTHAPVLKYKFRTCLGTPAAPTGCVESGWGSEPSWVVPSGTLSWSTKQFWQLNVDNLTTQSGWQSPDGMYFTPVIAQPGVTSHLAGAPEGADLPGVNPQVGNYTSASTDADVAVVGPALSVTRTYNSQDTRINGAFGPGWSTPWDQRVDMDGDNSGSVVVTLASGLQVRFGQNHDGTYAAPPGRNLDLVHAAGSPGTWTLRDPSGSKRVFSDATGRLLSLTDADNRVQNYTYTGGAAQGANLALNKPTTSSGSLCDPGTPGSKAVNGTAADLYDKWCSFASSAWLQIDLGLSQTVSSIVVQHAGVAGEPTAYNTRDFDLQVSTNGSTWTTVAAVTGNTANQTTHEFAPTQARYVKLHVTTPSSNGDSATRIFEVKVYGGSSASPPAAWLSTVTNPVANRTLTVQWAGPRIRTVTTNTPATGESALTWTYNYTDLKLTSVCAPLRASACTSYGYTGGSHYRSTVLDANPAGYWPLGEASGTNAVNVAARTGGRTEPTAGSPWVRPVRWPGPRTPPRRSPGHPRCACLTRWSAQVGPSPWKLGSRPGPGRRATSGASRTRPPRRGRPCSMWVPMAPYAVSPRWPPCRDNCPAGAGTACSPREVRGPTGRRSCSRAATAVWPSRSAATRTGRYAYSANAWTSPARTPTCSLPSSSGIATVTGSRSGGRPAGAVCTTLARPRVWDSIRTRLSR